MKNQNKAEAAPAAGRHSVSINGRQVNALKLLSDLGVERERSAALLEALKAAKSVIEVLSPGPAQYSGYCKARAAIVLAEGGGK
jgi:hypothetical protein